MNTSLQSILHAILASYNEHVIPVSFNEHVILANFNNTSLQI